MKGVYFCCSLLHKQQDVGNVEIPAVCIIVVCIIVVCIRVVCSTHSYKP